MRTRRRGGFTLVEMLVSVALAGMVVAGALELHLTFNRSSIRQQQLADMQQTLRLSMLIVERALRSAGAGMTGGELTASGCAGAGAGGGNVVFYGFEFSDDNTLANITGGARTVFDSTAAADDPDPDWFRTVAADSGSLPLSAAGNSGANLSVNDPTSLSQGWSVGDFFSVVDNNGNDCTRVVTHIPGGSKIQHNPGQSCFNSPPNGQDCLNNIPSGGPVRHFSGNYTFYRVDTSGATPRLMIGQSALGSASAPTWNVVAENIEDMQIAMVLKNGIVCGSFGNGTDLPPSAGGTCDPSQVEMVRLTMVARSAMPVTGGPPGDTGGYEDRPAVVVNDGYLRRSMTTEIDLRNMTGQ